MSVLACDRSRCDNIMCDRLIIGKYICDSCFDELVLYKDSWENEMSTYEIRSKIEAFMNTRAGAYIYLHGREEIDEEFDRLVRERY